MAYSFGGGVRPELGRTDFTPFLQGSVQGAKMQGRGAESMAAGVSQFLQKAGEGVKAYQENKAINTMFNSTVDQAIKINEQGNGQLANSLGIADPTDRAAWAAGIKSLGEGDKKKGSFAVRSFMAEMGMQEAQRAAEQGSRDRRAGIVGGAPRIPGQAGSQQGAGLNPESLIGLATEAAIEGKSEESKRYFDMAQSLNTQESQTLRDFRRIAGRDPESIEEFQKFKQSGAQSVNVNMGEGGVPLGSAPSGMEWARTESGQVAMERDPESGYMRPVAVPIKGGPVEREAQAERSKRELRQRASAVAGITVTQDLGRALDLLPNMNKAPNVLGANLRIAASKIPGTSEYEMDQFIQSALSNVGLDRLQLMRESSPTGGALGQVPFQQQQRLEQVLGSLKLGQSPEIIEQNLKRVQNIYFDVIYGDATERAEAVKDGRLTAEESDWIDGLYHDLPFGVTGRRGGQPRPDGNLGLGQVAPETEKALRDLGL